MLVVRCLLVVAIASVVSGSTPCNYISPQGYSYDLHALEDALQFKLDATTTAYLFSICGQLSQDDVVTASAGGFTTTGCSGQYACVGTGTTQGLGSIQRISFLPDFAGGDNGQGVAIYNTHGNYGTRGTTGKAQANSTIFMFCDPLRLDFTDTTYGPYDYTYTIFDYAVQVACLQAGGCTSVSNPNLPYPEFDYSATGDTDGLIFVGSSAHACSRRLDALSTRWLPNIVGWNDWVGYDVTISHSTAPEGTYLTTDSFDVVFLLACGTNGKDWGDITTATNMGYAPVHFYQDPQYNQPEDCFLLSDGGQTSNYFWTFSNGKVTAEALFGAHGGINGASVRGYYLGAVSPVSTDQVVNGLVDQSNGIDFDPMLFAKIKGLYKSNVLLSFNTAQSSDSDEPTTSADSGTNTYLWQILTNCHAPPAVTNGYWDCTNGDVDTGALLTGASHWFAHSYKGPLYTVVTTLGADDWDISVDQGIHPSRPNGGTDDPSTATTCQLKCNSGFQLSPLADAVFTTTCTFDNTTHTAGWSALPSASGPACVQVLVQHAVGNPCAEYSLPTVCPRGYVSMQDALVKMVEFGVGSENTFTLAGTDPFCYKVYPPFTADTWVEAQARCLNDGGDLAIVTNSDQNNFIAKLAGGARLGGAASSSQDVTGSLGYEEGDRVNVLPTSGNVTVFPFGVNGGPILLRGSWNINYGWQWSNTTVSPPLPITAPSGVSSSGDGFYAWASGQPVSTTGRGTPMCMGIIPCHRSVETDDCAAFDTNTTQWTTVDDCNFVSMSAFACQALRLQPAAQFSNIRNIFLGRITSPQTFIPTFTHVSDYRQFTVTWDKTLFSQTPLSGNDAYVVTISSLATPSAQYGPNQPVFNNGDIVYLAPNVQPTAVGVTDANGNPSYLMIDLSDNTLYENNVYLSLPASLQDNTVYQITITDPVTNYVGYTCFTAGYTLPQSTAFCANNVQVGNGANLLNYNALKVSFDAATSEVTFDVKLPYLQQGYIWDIDFQPWNFDLTSPNQCAVLSSLPTATGFVGDASVNPYDDLFSVAPSAWWLMNAEITLSESAVGGFATTTYFDYPLGQAYSQSVWKVAPSAATSSATDANCGYLDFQYTSKVLSMLEDCNMLINPRIDSGATVEYSGTVYATAIAVADFEAQPEPGTANLCGATRSCYSAFTYAINYKIDLQGLTSVISTTPTATQIAADAGLTFQLLSVTPSGTPVTTVQGNFITQVIVVVRVITGSLDDSIPASADNPSGNDLTVNGQPVIGTTVTQGAFVPAAQPGFYQRDYQYTIPNAPLVGTYNFHYRRRGCATGDLGCASITSPGTGVSVPLGNPDYVFAAPVNLAQVAPTLIVSTPLTLTVSGATGINPLTGATIFEGGDVITYDVQAPALLGVTLVLQNAWVCTSSGAAPSAANGGCQNPNNGSPSGPVTQILYIPLAGQVAVDASCSPTAPATTCTQTIHHIYYVPNGNQDIVSDFATHLYVQFQTGTQDYRKQIQLSAAPLQSSNQLYYIQIQGLVTASSSDKKREVKEVNFIVEGQSTRSTASQQQNTIGTYTVAGGQTNFNNNNGANGVTTSSSSSSSSSASSSMWAWLGPVIAAAVVAGIVAAVLVVKRRRTPARGKAVDSQEEEGLTAANNETEEDFNTTAMSTSSATSSNTPVSSVSSAATSTATKSSTATASTATKSSATKSYATASTTKSSATKTSQTAESEATQSGLSFSEKSAQSGTAYHS